MIHLHHKGRKASHELSRRTPFDNFDRGGGREKTSSAKSTSKGTSQLRLEKDLEELSHRRRERDFARSEINIYKDDDSTVVPNIRVVVYPLRGPFAGGRFEFDLKIPENYPYSPPVVHCLTRTFHPNICFYTGKTEFSILREGWRPVLAIKDVIAGLQLMFLEPHKKFATNKQCWELYCNNRPRYENWIRQSLRGGKYEGYDLVNHFAINYSSGSKRTNRSTSVSPGLNPPQKRRRLVSEITNKLSKTHVSRFNPRDQQQCSSSSSSSSSSTSKKRRMEWVEPCGRVSRRRSDDGKHQKLAEGNATTGNMFESSM